MSFKAACELFGGDEAVESKEMPLIYTLYDIAAEYWHIWNVEEVIQNMSKKQILFWLAYREQRVRVEKKMANEGKGGGK